MGNGQLLCFARSTDEPPTEPQQQKQSNRSDVSDTKRNKGGVVIVDKSFVLFLELIFFFGGFCSNFVFARQPSTFDEEESVSCICIFF